MMTGPPSADCDPAEVREALNAFTDEDWERYRLVAKYQLFRFGHLEPVELVSETVLRFLDGRRTWPRGTSLKAVFYNALRSVADEWRASELNREALPTADLAPNADGEQPTMEDLAVDNRQPANAVEAGELVAHAFKHFGDDQDVEAVLVGRMTGQTAEEVQAEFAMTEAEYGSARKRLERWLRAQS
jgi:DNA-directed RNA polymerase specialized sigma24 family protein